jgi:hypothetical protein
VEAQMTSSSFDEIDGSQADFDAADETFADDFEAWLSPPKRQPPPGRWPQWVRPGPGIDNFS